MATIDGSGGGFLQNALPRFDTNQIPTLGNEKYPMYFSYERTSETIFTHAPDTRTKVTFKLPVEPQVDVYCPTRVVTRRPVYGGPTSERRQSRDVHEIVSIGSRSIVVSGILMNTRNITEQIEYIRNNPLASIATDAVDPENNRKKPVEQMRCLDELRFNGVGDGFEVEHYLLNHAYSIYRVIVKDIIFKKGRAEEIQHYNIEMLESATTLETLELQ